jgi:predicted HicB family RNase H-like nuclease
MFQNIKIFINKTIIHIAMINTIETLKSKERAFTVKMPEAFHAGLKAEASLQNKSKNGFILELLLEGAKQYNEKHRKR